MKRYLIILLFALFFTGALTAATAKINKVWIEHGVTINNRSAMKVHCDFSVWGMKGKKGNMCIWIKGPSGSWHKVNSEHKSTTGTTYFKWAYSPSIDSAHYSDFWYAPYNDDLLLLDGKNKYKVVVTISDDNANTLAQSDEIEFTGTGRGGNSNNSSNRSNNSGGSSKKSNPSHNSGKKNNIVNTYRENLSFGGYAEVNVYANGFKSKTNYGKCSSCYGTATCSLCHGTRRCNICNGQGGIISAGYGNYYPCASCGGSGSCSLCKGSGKCICSNTDHPGYTAIGTSYYDANGMIINYTSFRVGTSDDNDKIDRPNSKRTCPDCGGTKLWRRGTEPEYAMPRTELIAVYNSAGEKCRYCNSYEKHWHSKCITCMNISGTENPYR